VDKVLRGEGLFACAGEALLPYDGLSGVRPPAGDVPFIQLCIRGSKINGMTREDAGR